MSTGYTHFNKVSGKNGVYRGAQGSEVSYPQSVSIAVPITAANTTNYVAAPIAGAVSGYVSWGVSTGTNHAVLVREGSAGTTLAYSGTVGVVAVIGTVTALTVSSPNTVSAGQALSVYMDSCATAQALTMAVITFTPTA